MAINKIVKYCTEMNPKVASVWINPDNDHDCSIQEGWYWTYDSTVLRAHYGPYLTKEAATLAAATTC